MKDFQNNSINLPKTLMGISMFLLLLFFAFWLHQSYQTQKDWLRKEVFYLFSESVHHIQDSLATKLIQQQIEGAIIELSTSPSSSDSLNKDYNSNQRNFTLNVDTISLDTKISFNLRLESEASSKMMIQLHANKDSVTKSTPQRRSRHGGPAHRKSFNRLKMINFSGDTIHIDSAELAFRFASNLKGAGIPLLTSIETLPLTEDWEESTDKIKTYIVPAGFPSELGYRGTLSSHQWYLILKIWPEIVVTLLLLLLVMFSFLIILNNLKQQQKLNLLKSDLISNITHELKTPVATVSIAIEALQHFNAMDNKEKAHDYLQMAQSELNRLGILIDRVLKTALFEQSRINLEMESVDINEIILSATEAMKLLMDKRNVKLEVDSTEKISLQADSSHLVNVLVNLLDNAVKYHPGSPEIKITVRDLPTFVQVTVQDNGPGIDRSYQNKVFDRFFRVPSGNLHNTKGTGLGLSYVKDVIKEHGGTIRLVSRVGEGTSFIIQLPKHDET